MKKTTKVTKALTPAKKTTKVVKTSAAPAATNVEPTAVVAPKPAAPAPKAVAPAPKPVAPPPKAAAPAPKPAPTVVVTKISANFDVGFGNSLYVRGEGPGLSWEKGLLMTCSPDGTAWTVQLGEAAKPFVFKFVINDEVWSGGDDYTAPAGSSVTLTPVFPGW